jgi:hypothetical protein
VLGWPFAAVAGAAGLALVLLCRSRRKATGLDRRRR